MSDILYVVSGLLLGLAFQGGLFLFAIPVALFAFVLAWLNRPSQPPVSSSLPTSSLPVLRRDPATDRTTVGRLFRIGTSSIVRDTFGAYPGDGGASLDKLKGNEVWEKLEQELDPVYNSTLQALRILVPKVHSVLLFLKSADGKNFVLRQFSTAAEDNLDPSAVIPDGSGVIGQLSLRDLSRILEGDMPNGNSLGYYSSPVPVHSVAGVPLLNNRRQHIGALVIDSLERNAFNVNVVPILDSFASMYFLLTFKSYSAATNYREKKKFYELSTYQQKFFKTTLLRDTYKEIFEYVNKNFSADRIMILVFDNPAKETGSVAFCRGEDEKKFEGMRFSLSDKGILPLAMMQHAAAERTFGDHPSEYVLRLNDDEPRNNSLHYLFVQPSSMTMHNAAMHEPSDIAICLERKYPVKFDQFEKDLLRFMVNIAYFAYQRGIQFEHEQYVIYHDALTGLLNRRTLDEKLKEFDRLRQEKNVGVMMMDIDHFKKINDTYGHQAGDTILKGIASRIASVAEVGDNLLARYGGEEFFVAIPDATGESLMTVAENIRKKVCATPFDIYQASPIPVSVSIGCYLVTPQFQGTMPRAVQYADDALYSAKESGRNQVIRYQEHVSGEIEAVAEKPADEKGI